MPSSQRCSNVKRLWSFKSRPGGCSAITPEKFSCWLFGRINRFEPALQVRPGELVVTLINASQQFTEAVVEVGLKDAEGDASMRWFKWLVVPITAVSHLPEEDQPL